ncbi:MAG TPA: TetR/AcrR family transcriptional regulator [Kofleriaceae bacterium]|nr:TetR/AcrR family transcriptional regulator [Kofleriaceae bacterium]
MPLSDKRTAILEAALDLFVERGYHGTAVPAVAERAGVGAGTIYRYFKSKEDLVNALFRHWKQALAGQIIAGVSPTAPPREQFHQLWGGLARFARNHPKVFAFLELHHHASYLDEESRATETRVLDLARAFVARLQDQGVLRPMPAMAIMILVYWGLVGLTRCAQEGRLDLTDDVLVQAEECLWDAIRA